MSAGDHVYVSGTRWKHIDGEEKCKVEPMGRRRNIFAGCSHSLVGFNITFENPCLNGWSIEINGWCNMITEISIEIKQLKTSRELVLCHIYLG